MKLLIIGNGFDIAHGLPTQYMDFLKYSYMLRSFLSWEKSVEDLKSQIFSEWKDNNYIKARFEELLDNREDIPLCDENNRQCYNFSFKEKAINQMLVCLYGNIWYEFINHKYKSNKIRGINWIDFENEIAEVIYWFEGRFNSVLTPYMDIENAMIHSDINDNIAMFHQFLKPRVSVSYNLERIINILYRDVERLAKSIEIYLFQFVEKMPTDKIDYIEQIKPDYVLSFNYTHTYNRVYGNESEICYVHGECSEEDLDNSHVVLGIGDKDNDNQKSDYEIFKKYIQRIRGKMDISYRQWRINMKDYYSRQQKMVESVQNSNYFNKGVSEVWIMGHSLDKTDGDILSLFLEPEYTSVSVYSKDRLSEGKMLSSLLRIISKDTLIKKANNIPPLFTSIVLG